MNNISSYPSEQSTKKSSLGKKHALTIASSLLISLEACGIPTTTSTSVSSPSSSLPAPTATGESSNPIPRPSSTPSVAPSTPTRETVTEKAKAICQDNNTCEDIIDKTGDGIFAGAAFAGEALLYLGTSAFNAAKNVFDKAPYTSTVTVAGKIPLKIPLADIYLLEGVPTTMRIDFTGKSSLSGASLEWTLETYKSKLSRDGTESARGTDSQHTDLTFNIPSGGAKYKLTVTSNMPDGGQFTNTYWFLTK